MRKLLALAMAAIAVALLNLGGGQAQQTETCATETTTVTSVGEITEEACARSALPQVSFVFPEHNTTWYGAFVLAAEETNNIPGGLLDEVLFEYSPDNGNTYYPIEQMSAGEMFLETVWQTADLAGGEYLVRVTLTDVVGNVSTDTMKLYINALPVAAAVFSCPDTTTVELDGTGSSDPDGSIAAYTWDFGDESPAGSGPLVSHTYDQPGTKHIGLSVVDDLGAIGLHYVGVNTFSCKAAPPKGCNPKANGMTVRGVGDADWKMGWIKKEADQRKLGRSTTIDNAAWEAAPKEKEFQIVVTFEVDVAMEANSNLEKCKEGQRIQRTTNYRDLIKHDRKAAALPHNDPPPIADNPPDGKVDCGFDNPEGNWCDDHYRKANKISGLGLAVGTKIHLGQDWIEWLDSPGTDKITKDDLLKLKGYKYQANFEASVKGDTRYVKCAWNVKIDFRAGTRGVIGVGQVGPATCSTHAV